jgi:hypothetical protein
VNLSLAHLLFFLAFAADYVTIQGTITSVNLQSDAKTVVAFEHDTQIKQTFTFCEHANQLRIGQHVRIVYVPNAGHLGYGTCDGIYDIQLVLPSEQAALPTLSGWYMHSRVLTAAKDSSHTTEMELSEFPQPSPGAPYRLRLCGIVSGRRFAFNANYTFTLHWNPRGDCYRLIRVIRVPAAKKGKSKQ